MIKVGSKMVVADNIVKAYRRGFEEDMSNMEVEEYILKCFTYHMDNLQLGIHMEN